MGEVALWLDPTFPLPSADVSMSPADGNLRCDTIRLAGGPGGIFWDNLVVGTTEASLLTSDSDSDGDNLPDAWEVNYGLDPFDDGTTFVTNGPLGDSDIDTLVNSNEFTTHETMAWNMV